MAKKPPSAVKVLAKEARGAERRFRAEHDPYFGKRRSAGEMGRTKSKAARSKAACRNFAY